MSKTVNKHVTYARELTKKQDDINNLTRQINIIIEQRANPFIISVENKSKNLDYSYDHSDRETTLYLDDVDDHSMKDWMVQHLRAKVTQKEIAMYKFIAENN